MTSKQFSGPVFLVGLPRSGTRLLRDVLNRNPLALPLDQGPIFELAPLGTWAPAWLRSGKFASWWPGLDRARGGAFDLPVRRLGAELEQAQEPPG